MEDHSSFLSRLQKWGNSPRVAMFWAIIGCICSFFCLFFLGLEEWQAVANLSPLRLMMMLLSCATTAGVYRVAFVHRHHRIMREEPSLFGSVMGNLIAGINYCALCCYLQRMGHLAQCGGAGVISCCRFRPVGDG